MTAKRERYLEEMGLGPVWRLRGRVQDSGSRIQDSGNSDTAAKSAKPERRPIEPPPPGINANAAFDLADDRAARILRMEWPELKAAVSGCQAQADWLLVGEAPGAEEDARGEPFVGQAGRLLDNMLAAIGLKRGDNVYICNVLKCRPPGNRNPEPFEMAQCTPHLLRQLELIKPKLILAMGRIAVQSLLSTEASIASLRGRLHRYRGVPLIVTYHPAYLLRNLPDKAKGWEDLCFARRTMASL